MSSRGESARGAGGSDLDPHSLLAVTGDFKDLVERLPLIVYVDAPDEHSRCLYISPQTTDVLGHTQEDWASRPDFFASILHPDDRERALAEVSLALATGDRIESEYRLLRRDGSVAWVHDEGVLVRDEHGKPVCLQGYMLDITARKRSQALAAGQAQLLAFVASGAELPRVLDRLVHFVEEHAEDELLASILLLNRDGTQLRHGAAPSLPAAYNEAIDGIAVGPAGGSCGTAAYRRERVCASDIATDPLWTDFREFALDAGLRSCWSTPILTTGSVVLGTFALYHREPRGCRAHDVELVEVASHVAGIAIERARSGGAARASEARYRDLFENASEPIATATLDERITEVNGAFERVLGYTREELIGSSLSDHLTPESALVSRRATERNVAGEVSGAIYEQEFTAKDGHSVIFEVSSRVIHEDGQPTGVQGICRDVTARRHAETELRRLSELNRHQALHDDLTGLPNRVGFAEQVEQAIDLAHVEGSQLAVLLMDLDRFKEINDTLGHRYGDLLLIELARRLEAALRDGDTVARLGGDEFGILLRDLSGCAADLERTLRGRILSALQEPFLVDGLPLHIEASIGVARYPAHGGDADLLLQRADVAMYLAKETGMAHAIYATELDRHDTASLTLLSELPRGIRNRELVLHFQPKLDIKTRRLVGVEALTRWQHPTRGLIMPGEFVPAAEKTELIQPLAEYVLDEALGQLARWQSEGLSLDVAVNLSARNLHDPRLPEQIALLLRKWRLPAHRLTVEITESAIISDPSKITSVIRRLKALGLGVAIDDFGTGYTSLAYLARLPITQLKIDRAFVQNMRGDADDAAIVRAVITIGHDLGLEVVAEGVESEETYTQLARLGCDTIQGYWLSHPLAPHEFGEWMARIHESADEAAA
jgi:diguanylate cyclase (GGDEF)-like protein/PAS domain S-box-containing protein